jgi:FMN phosphatase YigB (HAD superfamily)
MLTSHEARRVGIRMNVEDHLDPVIAEVAFGKRVTTVNDLTIEQILHRIADNTMKGEYKVLNIGSVEQNIKTNLETHAARGGSSPKKYDGAWKTNNIGRERLDDGVSLTSQELTREAIQWFERETGKSIADVQNQVLRMYRQGPYKAWAERMKKTYFPRVNHIQEQEETIHPPIELILFDAGNVLIDDPGNKLWERVWDKLQEKGLINPNLKQRYDAFVNPKDIWTKNKKKKSSVSIKTFLPGTLNDSVSEDEFYTQFFRHIGIAKPDTETIHYLFDNPDLYQPIPGMQELVADLAARGIRIGVLSDCSSIVNQTVKNRILSLYGNWIEEADVLMSSEIKTAKADEDTLAFVHARNHFQIDNPRRMIFVDDKAIFTGKAGLEYIPAHRFTKTEQLNHYLASKKFVSRATLQ